MLRAFRPNPRLLPATRPWVIVSAVTVCDAPFAVHTYMLRKGSGQLMVQAGMVGAGGRVWTDGASGVLGPLNWSPVKTCSEASAQRRAKGRAISSGSSDGTDGQRINWRDTVERGLGMRFTDGLPRAREGVFVPRNRASHQGMFFFSPLAVCTLCAVRRLYVLPHRAPVVVAVVGDNAGSVWCPQRRARAQPAQRLGQSSMASIGTGTFPSPLRSAREEPWERAGGRD